MHEVSVAPWRCSVNALDHEGAECEDEEQEDESDSLPVTTILVSHHAACAIYRISQCWLNAVDVSTCARYQLLQTQARSYTGREPRSSLARGCVAVPEQCQNNVFSDKQ
ncbi:hypothetical protein J6590_102148 [Homalodisca vitripennis]|nr:hypothetical protein J6590_102148 [Homalodisca vitripennis]